MNKLWEILNEDVTSNHAAEGRIEKDINFRIRARLHEEEGEEALIILKKQMRNARRNSLFISGLILALSLAAFTWLEVPGWGCFIIYGVGKILNDMAYRFYYSELKQEVINIKTFQLLRNHGQSEEG